MREIEAVIEQIQSVLAWDHDPDPEYMETLVADYTRNITAANERLRQCEALLSRGLRAEAIQQCESEPNLLEVTAILDFPEVEFWSDYVSQYELPPLPELLMDVAADLNDAYASAQPVDGFLKLHRLHALALSPLSVRIQILRELASKDKSNPVWLEDLGNYEVARQNQIESELETVLADRNTTQAAALEAELTGRKWTTRPPQDLIKKVQSTLVRLQTYDARKELKHVADCLKLAYAERDLDAARHYVDRWESLTDTAAVPEGDPVDETAAPALNWIAQEDRKVRQEGAYQSSVAALERSLERGASVVDLNRSAEAICLLERGLPAELAQRLEERKNQISRQAGRRTLIIIVSIAAVILIVGSVCVSFVLQNWHRQSVTENQQLLRQLLTDGRIEQAQDFYNRLAADSAAVAESEELQQLHEELIETLHDEQSRRNAFVSLLTLTETGIRSSPDRSDIEKSMGDLDRAESMAKDTAELEEVRHARNAVEAASQRIQARVDNQFLDDLEAATTRFRQRPDRDMEVNQALTTEFRSLKRRPHVSQSHKQPIDAVLRTLDAARADHQRQQKVSADLDRITAAVGDTDRYQSQLREYIQSHSGSRRSTAFQRVIATEAELWGGPRLWNELRDDWESLSLSDISSESASALQQQYLEFLKESKQFPAGHGLVRHVEALKAVIARVGKDHGAIQEHLREAFEFYLELPLVVVSGDLRYYTNLEKLPEESNGVIIIVPFKDDLLKRDSVKRIPADSVTNGRSGGMFVWDAPHTEFAQHALEELKEANQHWEESFGGLVTLLARDSGIDPIVKIKILYDLLRTGSAGSVFFQGAFEDSLAAVDRFDGFKVNWISPTASGALNARVRATAILDSLSPLDETGRRAVTKRDELAARKPGPVYRWIGWLHVSSDTTWTCSTGTPLQETDNGSLVVIVSQENRERPSEFARIGFVASGQLKLDLSGNSAGFVEGRPVYLVEDQMK